MAPSTHFLSGRFFVSIRRGFVVSGGWMLHQWQAHDRQRMIIGGHPADPFGLTAETPVHDHLLTISARRQTNWFH